MADEIKSTEDTDVKVETVISEQSVDAASTERHSSHHHHHHRHKRKRTVKERINRFFNHKKVQKSIVAVVIVLFVALVVLSTYFYDRKDTDINIPGDISGDQEGSFADESTLRLYSFGVLSDIHLQYESGNADFERALTYLKDKVDFTCIAGDLVSFASKENMAEYRAYVDMHAGAMQVYECAGNHDTYPELGVAGMIDEQLWKNCTDDEVYYSFEKGDDVFIMLGLKSEKPNELLPDGSLQWLENTLEENKNKRCFVFQHAPELTDATADPSGTYSDIMEGADGKAFVELIKKYPNTVWFHGHTHATLGLKQNPVAHLDYRSVHIPSLTAPRFYDVANNVLSDYYFDGYGNKIWGSTLSEGYIVDVYANKIVIRGINFAAGENGTQVQPFKDEIYALDTTLRVIEEE